MTVLKPNRNGSSRRAAYTRRSGIGEKARPATRAAPAAPLRPRQGAPGKRAAPIHQNAGGAAISTTDSTSIALRPAKSRRATSPPVAPPTRDATAAPPSAKATVCPREAESKGVGEVSKRERR